ncbi:MAG: hypothetical protein JRE16_00430 [Deltaproteobacteria bacterium]|jgi:hypothetical protein|nr:hypothetical protein [Deltaproteobacteria bacterium]MBW2476986.1 hypothetical protein [Deltaproteobacteria bacterium]MBW2503013.1 hypothetical protein [Deltaproteobacteria bacterium]MBW2518865.1 hypothetical protein [Deltaproteobacteria bacterium]
MRIAVQWICLTIIAMLATACSSTTMSGSWASPDFQGQIKNVYIIGITKNEINRRIFEDTFDRALGKYGVKGVSSYKDLPAEQEANKDAIKERMLANGTDSVLLTQLIDQRTESVTTPGRVSGYSSGPYYGDRGYYDRPYYRNWGSYYDRRYDITYEPPTTTQFVVLTVESVLYDLKTEEMIWSAQLETVVDGNIDKMIQDFAEVVTKDLSEKGMI